MADSAKISQEQNCEVAFAIFFEALKDRVVLYGPITGTKTSVPSPVQKAYVQGLGHFPPEGFALLSCHFHPPDSILIPSSSDLSNIQRSDLRQTDVGVRVVDVVALAKGDKNVDYLAMQQTNNNMFRSLYEYLSDRSLYFEPFTVFSEFRRRMNRFTFNKLFPDQPDFAEDLVFYADGCSQLDFLRLAKLLPPNYCEVFAQELEDTGFYRAHFGQKKV